MCNWAENKQHGFQIVSWTEKTPTNSTSESYSVMWSASRGSGSPSTTTLSHTKSVSLFLTTSGIQTQFSVSCCTHQHFQFTWLGTNANISQSQVDTVGASWMTAVCPLEWTIQIEWHIPSWVWGVDLYNWKFLKEDCGEVFQRPKSFKVQCFSGPTWLKSIFRKSHAYTLNINLWVWWFSKV